MTSANWWQFSLPMLSATPASWGATRAEHWRDCASIEGNALNRARAIRGRAGQADGRWGARSCIRQGASCEHQSGKVTIDAAYVVANTPIVREQLQKAGVRLAHLLDAALRK
jgi:hypothetical protein